MRWCPFSLRAVVLVATLTASVCQGSELRFRSVSQDVRVPRGQNEVRVEFIFRNEGRDRIGLRLPKVACDCARVETGGRNVYRPGDKGRVVVVIPTQRAIRGPSRKTIRLHTDERSANTVELAVNLIPEESETALADIR